MKPILSICIPTLNRPQFLLNAIKSIFQDLGDLEQHIEVCISNNCSEADYSEAEKYIEIFKKSLRVNYVCQNKRLPIDENMHFVKKMSSADYVYFLGDDDYFLKGQLKEIVEFIATNLPDLAIFNGILVDDENKYLGMHFSLLSKQYLHLEEAFTDLRDKGMFGAILVRKCLLDDSDFIRLYGTAHAYGCYWFSIFRKNEQGEEIRIYIPNFPAVALRCSEKSYNHVYVYYRDIMYETSVYKRFSPPGSSQILLSKFEANIRNRISSLRFMCSIADFGCDLTLIKEINPSFYFKYAFKIEIAKFISSRSLYKKLKEYLKRKRLAGGMSSVDKVNFNDINVIQ